MRCKDAEHSYLPFDKYYIYCSKCGNHIKIHMSDRER